MAEVQGGKTPPAPTTWAERVQRAYDSWHRWVFVPGRFRMDRALKDAGTRDLIVALGEAEKAIGSLLWVFNNLHNHPSPQFATYREAAEQDARRALNIIKAAGNA